jgi:Putative transposase/Transposase zinc-binding domain
VRPGLEVADIFRRHGDAFRAAQSGRLSSDQRRVMAAIEACRTATLGGHVERCDDCGLVRIAYNSCRDRHCPKCQGLARAQWLADRQADLLPIAYFHVVFTVPAPIAAIALQNKAVVYDMLLKTAAETIRLISADPKHLGAETGMIAILHTWGQTLTHHPHAHCLVPGGGIVRDGSWISCRPGFFLPVRVLSRLYRRLFLERLHAAFDDAKLQFFGHLEHLVEPPAFARHLNALRKVKWVVYAKRPFGGPERVLAYLGRYTHRVAIANSRLLAYEHGHVRLRWKDYRAGNKSKVMTLDAEEFIRRFLLHVLPKGFRRIRHFGFLANACRAVKLARIRAALKTPEPPPPTTSVDYRERYAILTGHRIDLCPICGGQMIDIGLALRSPTLRRAAPRSDTS